MSFVPIATKKASMGFMNANHRPCCRNCAHSEQVKPSYAYNDVYPWRCQKGGFGVTANAVCKEHAPARKGGAA